MPEKYILLTGSDLGDRNANLQTALELIGHRIGKIIATSEIMETEPWGFRSETRFLNQAILIETRLAPESLLKEILEIEQAIGRERKDIQWVSRVIDIDILCGQNIVHHSDHLTIPHTQLHLRKFALTPLCQLAATWTHPILYLSYEELLFKLNDGRTEYITA